MKNKTIIKIIIIISALGYLVVWFDAKHNRWSDRKIKDTIVTGYEIIEALNSFYAKQKSYPEKLSELVPGYISEIQKPAAGTKEWNYYREKDKYRISFKKEPDDEKPYIYYDLIYLEWIEVKN